MNDEFRSGLKVGLLLGGLTMGFVLCVTIQLYHDRLVEVKARAKQDSEDEFKSCVYNLNNLAEQCSSTNKAIPEQSEELRRF